MNNNDKYNYLLNLIKLMRNNPIKKEDNKEIENKKNELILNINKKDKEIKDILENKDIINNLFNKKRK